MGVTIPSCRRLQLDTTRRMNDKKQEATHTNTKINRKRRKKDGCFFKNVIFSFVLHILRLVRVAS